MRRSTSGSLGQLLGLLAVLAVFGVGLIVWYSNEVNDTGVITSKWTESHTSSCSSSDTKCTPTTSITYLIQLDNGNVYEFLWKSRDYDRVQVGQKIRVHARGRAMQVVGFRVTQPTITDFSVE